MEPKNGMTRYSVRRVFELILRRWYWPFIFAAVFAVAISYYFWSNYSSSYQVSSTFIPLSQQTSYYTASALAENDMVLDAVKNSVDFETSISELSDAIFVDADINSFAVTVTVVWSNTEEAKQILEALKANLSYAVTHSANAGEIKWLDAASSDSGQLPSSTTKSYQIFIIGALIGLLLGMVLSYTLGALDKRVFNIETVNYGRDVKVIGTVGKIKIKRASESRTKMPIVDEKSNKQFIAAVLYLNKLMNTDDKKLLMCVSPTSKCGTSTIVRNIAKVLSSIKADILIIKIEHTSKKEKNEPKIRPIFTGAYEVNFPSIDSENHGAFLDKILNMIFAAKSKFNLIIVDCPALLDNVQVSMIAEAVDASLLVGRYGVTKKDEILSAVSLLSRSGAESIYTIWNFAEKQNNHHYPIEPVSDEGKGSNVLS